MFGFSPIAMGSGGKSPFNFSGTFSSDLEGWVTGAQARWDGGDSSRARTLPGCLLMVAYNFNSNWAEYTIPAEIAGGMQITASVWTRTFDSETNNNRRIRYKIGAGSFSVLANVRGDERPYRLLSGTFSNPTESSVTIRLDCNAYGAFDDWAISGVLL